MLSSKGGRNYKYLFEGGNYMEAKEIYEKLKEIEESIDSRNYEDAPIIDCKRIWLLDLMEYLPKYKTLSKKEKAKFPLNTNGLANKVLNLMEEK